VPRVEQAIGSPKIVYAVMTCNQAEKQQLLQAQLDTWAGKAAAQGRFFAVTGDGFIGNVSRSHIIRTDCDDSKSGLTCKEAHIMKTGYDWKADWLVVLGEDNYVDTAQVEDFLVSNGTGQSTIMGIVGCAGACGFDGLCGGGGYFVSRAALQDLFAADAKRVMMEYKDFEFDAGDAATACIFQKNGVKLTNVAEYLIGANIMTKPSLQSAIELHPMTLHYLTTPASMYWVHSSQVKQWAKEDAHSIVEHYEKLATDAFPDGCCCWPDEIAHQLCLQEVAHPSLFALNSLIPDLQLRYMRDRTMHLSMEQSNHSKAGSHKLLDRVEA